MKISISRSQNLNFADFPKSIKHFGSVFLILFKLDRKFQLTRRRAVLAFGS